MRYLGVFLIIAVNLCAWETTTHRAIDRFAIAYSKNLNAFVNSAGIKNTNYGNQIFDGYINKYTGGSITYFDYFNTKYSNDAMADWDQVFSKNKNYQDLLEAGTMLEDALYPDSKWYTFGGDGRFNNHFYDPQNGGRVLTYGYGKRVNAKLWAINGGEDFMGERKNRYDYNDAINYFYKAFTENNPALRRKYQAKMLVAVGHLMHLVNDV